jgi:hypothetical protein
MKQGVKGWGTGPKEGCSVDRASEKSSQEVTMSTNQNSSRLCLTAELVSMEGQEANS